MLDFFYRNESDKMVVLRCIGADNYFLERVLQVNGPPTIIHGNSIPIGRRKFTHCFITNDI